MNPKSITKLDKIKKTINRMNLDNVPRGPWMNMSPEQQAKWEKAMNKGQKNFGVEFRCDGERTRIPTDVYPAFQRAMGSGVYPTTEKSTFKINDYYLDEILEGGKFNPHQRGVGKKNTGVGKLKGFDPDAIYTNELEEMRGSDWIKHLGEDDFLQAWKEGVFYKL